MEKGIILVENMTKEELESLRAGKVNYGFETQDEADKARISETLIADEVQNNEDKGTRAWIDVLNLHKNMSSWAIYRPNVAPIKGNEFAYLNPRLFNGLSYISYNSSNYSGVKLISTNQFGQVQIYAPRDEDSCLGSCVQGSAEHFILTKDPEAKNFGTKYCKYGYDKHN
ncbi:MAG: hypothetical protein ACRC6F_10220 [Aeromonas sp.]